VKNIHFDVSSSNSSSIETSEGYQLQEQVDGVFFFNGVMDHVRGLYVCSENLTCKWCDGGLAKIHLLTDEAAAASQTVSK